MCASASSSIEYLWKTKSIISPVVLVVVVVRGLKYLLACSLLLLLLCQIISASSRGVVTQNRDELKMS